MPAIDCLMKGRLTVLDARGLNRRRVSEGGGYGHWVAIDPNLSLQCSSDTRMTPTRTLTIVRNVWVVWLTACVSCVVRGVCVCVCVVCGICVVCVCVCGVVWLTACVSCVCVCVCVCGVRVCGSRVRVRTRVSERWW